MNIIKNYYYQALEDKKSFLNIIVFGFVLGIVAHGYAMTNFSPTHDYVNEFFQSGAYYNWQTSLGRFLQPVYAKVTGTLVAMPWINIILSILFVGLSAYVIIKVFNITNTIFRILIVGIMIANISEISLMATYVQIGADNFALLMSVLAFYGWVLYLDKKDNLLLLESCICLFISMGLYQSYITVTITLCLFYSCMMLLKKTNYKDVVINGLLMIAIIIVSGACYYLAIKVVPYITGVALSNGKSNSLSSISSNPESILTRIYMCYKGFALELIKFDTIFPKRIMILVILFISLLSFLLFIKAIFKNKIELQSIILLCLLVVVMPLGMNALRLINTRVHDLMIYSMSLYFIIPIILLSNFTNLNNSFANKGTIVLLSIVLLSNIQLANVCYIIKQMEYDSSRNLMNNIIYSVEQLDDYVPGETEVIIVGDPGTVLTDLPHKHLFKDITGLTRQSAFTYSGTIKNFVILMQRDVNVVTVEKNDSPGFIDAMNYYPQKGSVRMIDGKVYIKFHYWDE